MYEVTTVKKINKTRREEEEEEEERKRDTQKQRVKGGVIAERTKTDNIMFLFMCILYIFLKKKKRSVRL